MLACRRVWEGGNLEICGALVCGVPKCQCAKKYERRKKEHNLIEEEIDIIIIGSGISSLITAAYLSKYGKKILVLENTLMSLDGQSFLIV